MRPLKLHPVFGCDSNTFYRSFKGVFLCLTRDLAEDCVIQRMAAGFF